MINRSGQIRCRFGIFILLLLLPIRLFRPKQWNEWRTTAFALSAGIGDLKALRFLMRLGASLEDRESMAGATALMWASGTGQKAIVTWLLDHGATVNAVNDQDTTALMEAAQSGHVEIMETLIAAGADVNACNIAGFTALFLAAQSGHIDALETLGEAGADVDAGRIVTPLRMARELGHSEAVNWLELQGALE